jgi:hypothetical protein
MAEKGRRKRRIVSVCLLVLSLYALSHFVLSRTSMLVVGLDGDAYFYLPMKYPYSDRAVDIHYFLIYFYAPVWMLDGLLGGPHPLSDPGFTLGG